jgi:hypothetical protein
MNYALAALLLATCACAATAQEASDDAVNAALESARAGCAAKLADPQTKWGPGAENYCRLIVNGGCVDASAAHP